MKTVTNPGTTVYQLDGEDCITDVNSIWSRFALQNDAPELGKPDVLGQSIWQYLSGQEVRHIYQLVFHHVRTFQRQLILPFRCDSPDKRRFMELQVKPGQYGVLYLAAVTLRIEERQAVAALTPGQRNTEQSNTEEFVTICSWCKCAQIEDNHWAEIEEAIRVLEIFSSTDMPNLTHGVCPACKLQIEHDIQQSCKA